MVKAIGVMSAKPAGLVRGMVGFYPTMKQDIKTYRNVMLAEFLSGMKMLKHLHWSTSKKSKTISRIVAYATTERAEMFNTTEGSEHGTSTRSIQVR
jgi:hypothetical protein